MPKFCGKPVNFMRITSGISCGWLSPDEASHIAAEQHDSAKPSFSPIFIPVLSPAFSPYQIAALPLMNTIFTHFPQHLLLTSPKKEKKGY